VDKPETLSADEILYHRKVVSTMQRAQQIMDHANLLDRAWWEHLMERYGLTPDDAVDADGVITRTPTSEDGA
jgi:hypothetical protein